MRLWSLHPCYFDRQALTAAWREALLAQAVLAEPGKGYSNHPQLERFRQHAVPLDAIGAFLAGIADEADARGYRFDRRRIRRAPLLLAPIPVTDGQLAYEWMHLRVKLEGRSPLVATRWAELTSPASHPLFTVVDGPIAPWERTLPSLARGGGARQNGEQRKAHRGEESEESEVGEKDEVC